MPGLSQPGAAVEVRRALFKEYTFTVTFSAHYGPALDFVRRLEESEAGVFVIRTAEVRRIERLDTKPEAFANAIRNEAPVTVEVTASLLEFAGQEGG